jgi:hypothetical protein
MWTASDFLAIVDGRNSEQRSKGKAVHREAAMVHRIASSAVFGLIASIATGGILPTPCVMAAAFLAAIIWRWFRR